MSGDGAAQGISSERALKTILGGEPAPGPDEGDSAEAVRERVLAAALRGGDAQGYSDCADMIAGMILLFWQAHPEAVSWPASQDHHYELPDGTVIKGWHESAKMVLTGPDLSDAVNAFTEGKLDALGPTGFMWGWAVNTARWITGQPPVPNPAIITLGG